MLIVDNIYGEYVVCEDSEQDYKIVKIAKIYFPPNISEGDCVLCENGEYKIDVAETLRRRNEAAKLLKNLYD